jgi:hypothetical protein
MLRPLQDDRPEVTVIAALLVLLAACGRKDSGTDHADKLASEGKPVAPGNVADAWVQTLEAMGASVSWRRVTFAGALFDGCAPLSDCSADVATANHLRWPDGFADGGEDHEPAMLDFLRDHPL